MDNDLYALRSTVSRTMIPLLWIQVPLIAGVAYALGNDWIAPAFIGVVVAAIATAAWKRAPGEKSSRLTIAVALIAMVSLILVACQGSVWQIDVHMCYFAALAILAAYCDRDVILAGAGATALHHLGLTFVAPALLLPGGPQIGRIFFHAGVVVIEAAVLVWIAQRIVSLFASGALNLASAVNASETAHALEMEAAKARSAADLERERAAAERAAAVEEQAEAVRCLGDGLKRVAAGDLRVQLSEGFTEKYAQIRDDFNEAVAALKGTVLSVVSSAAAIQAGSQEISTASDDLSRRTEQQAASLEETAAALDEITQTLKKSAEGADHARDVVAAADQDAKQSTVVVRQAVEAMDEIAKSSQQISQIIGVIDEIAFQTNLLALNAGVEAARAGDAGRGFAVVASEVRALAQRSAEAAKEIKGLISASSAQVGTGVKLVAETGRSLDRIMAQVNDINKVVAEIATGSKEQATGLAEINTAINQMDQMTQQNAAMVEETTAASHSLSRETDALTQLTSRFQVGAEISNAGGHAPARGSAHSQTRQNLRKSA